MKYIETYEGKQDYSKFYGIGLEKGIKVGDYVLMKGDIKGYTSEYLEFLSNTIGVIVGINWVRKTVKVKFNKPYMGRKGVDTNTFYFIQMDYWTDDLDDIQYRVDAKKYNI